MIENLKGLTPVRTTPLNPRGESAIDLSVKRVESAWKDAITLVDRIDQLVSPEKVNSQV